MRNCNTYDDHKIYLSFGNDSLMVDDGERGVEADSAFEDNITSTHHNCDKCGSTEHPLSQQASSLKDSYVTAEFTRDRAAAQTITVFENDFVEKALVTLKTSMNMLCL